MVCVLMAREGAYVGVDSGGVSRNGCSRRYGAG